MIFTSDRRLTLLHIALTGMDALWATPLFLLLWPTLVIAPTSLFLTLWVWALLWMAVLELADAWFHPPDPAPTRTAPPTAVSRVYVGVVLGVLAISTLVIIHDSVYAAIPWTDGRWITLILNRLARFSDSGLHPETLLLLTNVGWWLYAGWANQRNLTSLNVQNGLWFRFLLLLATASAWGWTRPPDAAIPFVVGYFALGMLALTLTRLMEVSARSAAAGRALPLGWLAQLGGMIALFGGGAWLAATALLGPIYILLGWVPLVADAFIIAMQMALVLAMVLAARVGRWLGQLLGIKAANPADSAAQQQAIEDLLKQFEKDPVRDILLPEWALAVIRALPLILLLVGLGLVFLLIARRLRRRRLRATRPEDAELAVEAGDWLRRGLDRLRDLAGLVQKFGVSGQLLAAISVQNLYANLCRLAAREGHPRRPATPPDTYLPTLVAVFGKDDADRAAALGRLTDAYMRVHYGDQPITAQELRELQADYRQILDF